MCPQCYITALLVAMFGSSAMFIVQNPVVIIVSTLLFALAGFWLWKGYKRNQGKGGLVKNMGATVVFICIFMLGYLVASFQTHLYFTEKIMDLQIESN